MIKQVYGLNISFRTMFNDTFQWKVSWRRFNEKFQGQSLMLSITVIVKFMVCV